MSAWPPPTPSRHGSPRSSFRPQDRGLGPRKARRRSRRSWGASARWTRADSQATSQRPALAIPGLPSPGRYRSVAAALGTSPLAQDARSLCVRGRWLPRRPSVGECGPQSFQNSRRRIAGTRRGANRRYPVWRRASSSVDAKAPSPDSVLSAWTLKRHDVRAYAPARADRDLVLYSRASTWRQAARGAGLNRRSASLPEVGHQARTSEWSQSPRPPWRRRCRSQHGHPHR